MPQISEIQIEKMELVLDNLMNIRLELTKKSDAVDSEISSSDSSDSDSDESETERSTDSKYDPPVTYKEHYLSHLGKAMQSSYLFKPF